MLPRSSSIISSAALATTTSVIFILLCPTTFTAKTGQSSPNWHLTAADVGAPVRYNTNSEHFVYGDTWSATWSVDAQGKDVLYSTTDDTHGFNNDLKQPDCKKYCGRNLALISFDNAFPPRLTGSVVNDMKMFGGLAQPAEGGPAEEVWKANGLISVSSTLYMTVSRHIYGQDFFDFRQRAQDSTILVSKDHGQTWDPQPTKISDPIRKAMFPGARFATPFFVEYGRDGTIPASVDPADRADTFVYAVSTNGFWDNGDELVLGRVKRSAVTDADQWEFFDRVDSDARPHWKSGLDGLNAAKPILSSPGRCSMAGIQFIPALGLYVLPEWYYPDLSSSCDPNPRRPVLWGHTPFSDPIKTCIKHSRWQFYSARHPWGPWTLFFEQDFAPLLNSYEGGYYNPYIPSKFIDSKVASDGTVSMWIFATGNFATGGLEWSKTAYTLYMFPLRLHAIQEK